MPTLWRPPSRALAHVEPPGVPTTSQENPQEILRPRGLRGARAHLVEVGEPRARRHTTGRRRDDHQHVGDRQRQGRLRQDLLCRQPGRHLGIRAPTRAGRGPRRPRQPRRRLRRRRHQRRPRAQPRRPRRPGHRPGTRCASGIGPRRGRDPHRPARRSPGRAPQPARRDPRRRRRARSRSWSPDDRYFLAIETTRRRFAWTNA